jgi:hypothetical protein
VVTTKSLALFIALLATGYSSLSVSHDDVDGTYFQSDLDAELRLQISKDGSYEVSALTYWKMTEEADGSMSIATELRERGQ